MQSSDAVRDHMLRFYDRLSASDVGAFESLVSDHDARLVVGTAPGEWVTEEVRLRAGFETEGVGMTPGPSPAGWEDGSAGWFTDEPVMSYPDGSRIHTRLTSVLHRGDHGWRMVHMHVSVGVPDEEVIDLQRRWGTAPS